MGTRAAGPSRARECSAGPAPAPYGGVLSSLRRRASRGEQGDAGNDRRCSGGRDGWRPLHVGFGREEYDATRRDRGCGDGEDGEQARPGDARQYPLLYALVEGPVRELGGE